MRGLILYLLTITVAAVALFLYASSWFSSWDGRAASVRPTAAEEPTVFRVLVVDDDASRFEMSWTKQAISGLNIPPDALALPPRDLSDRPRTRKLAYTLTYDVEKPGELDPEAKGDEEPARVWHTFPTTSPQGLAMAVMVWLIGFAIRNMYISGSPIEIMPRERTKIAPQRAIGNIVPQTGRSKKAPPPSSKGKKGRRKR